MNAVNQIELKINERGLVKGLQHAFTTKKTLFKELLQNGDRAGATEIRIAIEDEGDGLIRVEIVDDGCGISDMAVLLSVAESGWSEELVAERTPYGLGFLSALYATRAIEVESRGSRIAFDSADALGFMPVAVITHPESAEKPGTRLVLHGLKLVVQEARSAVRTFARGFPVRVMLDGEEVARPHALGAEGRHFVKTAVGLVSIPAHVEGDRNAEVRANTHFYLQGFKVHSARGWENAEHGVVVHLDPSRFIARMPDRDVLIDQNERIREVDAAIAKLWRDFLAARKSVLPAAEFIDRHWEAIQTYARDMLNDIPLLPRQALERFTDWPFLAPEWESFSETPANHLTMEEVSSGKLLLLELDDIEEDGGIATWNYARARDALLISTGKLDAQHWARDYVVSPVASETNVNVHGEYGRGQMNGSYVWGNPVVLCDSFEIFVSDDDGRWKDSVTVDDTILFDGHNFLVPRQAKATGWAVQQANDYMDEERYQEDERESDWDDLQRKILELRGLAPAEILSGILEQRKVSTRDYPSLHGKSFALTINENGDFTVAEQVIQQ